MYEKNFSRHSIRSSKSLDLLGVELADALIAESELGRCLRDIYCGLSASSSNENFVRLTVGSTDLELTTTSVESRLSNSASSDQCAQPYQTLLLLVPRHQVLAKIPPKSHLVIDWKIIFSHVCYKGFAQLVRGANPTKSFHELSSLLGMPMQQLVSVWRINSRLSVLPTVLLLLLSL